MTLKPEQHKNLLFQILKDIYSDTSISPYLGFKGGTAAYIFYDLPRFSVDIDLDLLDESKEKLVFSKVEEIVKKYGQLKESITKRYNWFFLVSYEKEAQNIKVEINRRSFGSEFELKTYLGVSMLVMKQDDMLAHKLMALYERLGHSNRDMFDVWYFLHKNWPIDKKLVEDRAGTSYKNFLGKCIRAIEAMEDESILAGMGELLDAKQKAWAKKSLKNDLIFLLKLALENEK